MKIKKILILILSVLCIVSIGLNVYLTVNTVSVKRWNELVANYDELARSYNSLYDEYQLLVAKKSELTYEDLIETPNKYLYSVTFKDIKISGTVYDYEIYDDGGSLYLAYEGNQNKMIWCALDGHYNIENGDVITIEGPYMGISEYFDVPSMNVHKMYR